MDSLPPELLARIASLLCTADLLSMRFVNKRYAAIALRPLFEVLRFSGRRQDQIPPWNFGPSIERELSEGQVGRTRTVEYAKLPEVVDEIVGNSLARYTKMFVFDPAYYRDLFWDDYNMQLQNEMYEPVEEDELDGFDGDDPDEHWDAAIERVLEYRRARPVRETEAFNAAQVFWQTRRTEQIKRKQAVTASLIKLFQTMTALEEITIKPWVFDGRLLFPGLESCISYGIDVQRRGSFPTTIYLATIAGALYAADQKIKRLHVSEFFAEELHDSLATRHIFTGLQELRLDVLHIEFLLDEGPKHEVLVELFKCARPTLRKLWFAGGGKWPSLPARGGHSLLKMLSDQPDETPLVFPQLEFVHLSGLILSTPSLLRFLRAQPNLEHLEFGHIYLSTPQYGWPILVEELPASIKSWKVCGPLGHEPIEADGPAAYNWMRKWMPKELSPISGWKVGSHEDGAYFERIG